MLIGDFAREGQFLLWNPFVNGGSPDHVEPQVGAFSPIVLLFGFLWGGTRHTFDFYWLTIWLLGGMGTLVLARHLGAPAWGGLVAALGFSFSGFYTGNAQHTSMLSSISFLPFTIWRLDTALTGRTYRPAVEAGALWGLSALAGYPGLVLLNACFAALWSFGRAAWPTQDETHPVSHTLKARLTRAVSAVTLMVLVGSVVMSPSYVAFFVEAPGFSHRPGGLSRGVATENDAFHPACLATLASPVLPFANICPYTDVSMRSIYLGSLVPVFATFAVLQRRRPVFRWWLVLIALGFLVSAMGRALPVRGWLYDWFPPTQYFRHSALFRCYFLFALTVLGIFGSRDLGFALQTKSRASWRDYNIASVWMAAACLSLYTVTFAVSNATMHVWAHVHTWGLWLSVCVLVGSTSLLGWKWRGLIVPPIIVALAIADALSTGRISRSLMYGVEVKQWSELDILHESELDLTSQGLKRIAINAGNLTFIPKIPALRGYGPLAGPWFEQYADDPVLLASATGTDRLWFSPVHASTDRSDNCFAAFRARATALGAPPLVVHPPGIMRQRQPQSASESSLMCEAQLARLPAATRLDATSIRVLSYEPRRLSLDVNVPKAGWLLVTDSWSRGWKARINGQSAPISGGNFIFRAVQVASGRNLVDFGYEPFGFPWLVIASWCTLGAVAVLTFRSL
jgi:hypothetical protein